MRQKRAEFWAADTTPFYILAAGTLSLIVILFLFYFSSQATDDIGVPADLDGFVHTLKPLMAPDCFLHSEEDVYRAYILDAERFTSDVLNECTTTHFPVEMTLFFNEQKVEIRSDGWKEGGLSRSFPKNSILVMDGEEIYTGEIQVKLQK